ncbi:lipoprotein insertase outer membrane protein LolB [Ferribacterium limneticum]|uniref:lipoprotein insertase outer membrane protein LolB n=1 Tax=Ferribacterium limneticum TaxID=76259 RepID=UPI001CF9E879|nr:lipoprotein insertase outer membrane protein LolB [Ferribacterium limneticum]UCV28057.1 lipoprotein insertase outer membrane protein LolB [Ferribacterium limneticum]UCV31974.1 lipoprotein insertase outer membrane protein LolB [Ferribacterium limneticum]
MSRCFSLLLAASLLAGCASRPPALLLHRDKIRDFSLEGRFALRVTMPGQAPQNSGGRLTWTHQNRSDRVLLSSPLGYGLAEIETTPELSQLRTAEGKQRESTDPDALIEEVTGQRLPVTRMPAWLLGRSGGTAQISPDPAGRPGRLIEDGWQVDYAYDDEASSALPSRLNISRNGEIELKLRIEEWKERP